MKRQVMWSIGAAGIALGLLGILGSGAIASELGPLVRGYGLLVTGAALYMLAGLGIRELLTRAARGSSAANSSSRPVGQS